MGKDTKTLRSTLIIFLFIVFYSEPSLGNILNAQFSTNPATVSGTVTICKTQAVVFTDSSTGTSPSTAYNWQFAGGSLATATTSGPHTVTYNTPGTYTASLTLDNTNTYSITVVVTNNQPSAPSIALVDGNFWASAVYNNQNYFTYCSNDAAIAGGLFSFTTQSTQSNASTQHIFDWGDGTTDTYTGANLGETFHFYTTAGYYTLTYTVVLSNACSSQRTYNLYVGAIPTATISAVGIPALCNPGSVTYNLLIGAQNTPGTLYTFQVNDGTPPVTFNHPPPASITHQFLDSSCGTTSNINSTVYPNSYQASITISNPCGNSTNAVGPINIQSAPIANFTRTPNNNIICEGATVAISDNTQGGYNIGGPPTYTCTQTYKKYWTISGPSGLIATSTGGILATNPFISCPNNFGYNNNQSNNPGAWLPSAASVLNVTFLQPGNYTITFYTGSNLCGISSATQTICVTPRVTADFSMISNSLCAPTIITTTNNSSNPGCANTNNYNWTVTPSNPNNCPSFNANDWSFSSGNATALAPEITINSPGIYNISLTTSLNTPTAGALCQPDTKTTTFIVKGKPITSLTAETICEGNTITLNPIVYNCYANDPVSYTWDFGATPPTSISGINDASPVLIFNSPGVYNYTLTISNECGSNSYNSSITVVPSVNLTANVPLATCVNTSIQLTSSITGGVTGGTWTSSLAGGIFSPSATDLNPTYTPPIDFIGSITFTLTSDTPIAPCTIATATFTTNFNSEATVATGTYTPLCENGSIVLNGSISGAASSASWSSLNGGVFSDPTNLNTTYTPIPGYVGTVTLTLTSNDPDGPCEVASQNVDLIVLPTPSIDPKSDLFFCNGEVVNSINFTGTNANLYTWTNSNTAIGLPSNGNGNINFTATNSSTSPITSTITITPVNTISGALCPGIATSFTITINPEAQVNDITNQTICNASSTAEIVFSTANTSGITSYVWTNDTPSIGLASNGVGNIPSFITQNNTNTPIIATIEVTPTYTLNGISCIGTPKVFNITINPEAQVNTISDMLFCEDITTTPIAFTSLNTNGVNTYEWTNNNTLIGLSASGTGPIPSFATLNTSTSEIVATITITPYYTNNGVTCSGTAETFTITVIPNPQVNPLSNETICNGGTINSITISTSNTIGITSYEWANDNPSIGLASNGIGDIPSFTVNNPTLSPIVATITVTPVLQYNGVNCPGASESFTITILPDAQVNSPLNATFCNASTTTPISFSTNTTGGIVTYEWTNNNTSIGLATNGIGNIPGFITNNTSTTPEVATITVTPYYNFNGIICNGVAETFEITINPNAQVNTITNQEICNGTATNQIVFSTNSTFGTTTYNWTNDNATIGLPATGTGVINAFTATNNSLNPIIATITVTPTYTYNSISCVGSNEQFTITVNPSPVVLFSENDQVICSNENTIPVQLTSSTSGVSFNWNATVPVGINGAATSGTDTIPIQNLINTTNTSLTITYQAFATTNDATACQGIEFTYLITVLPKPSISNETLLLCSEQTFNYASSNGVPNNTTIVPNNTIYTWTISNNPAILGASNGSGTQINQTLTNTTATSQTITYTVTPSAFGCQGNTFTLLITVLPKPDVLFSIGNQTICNQETTLPITLSSTITGLYDYTWTATIPTGITGALASGTSIIPAQTLINSTNVPLIVSYTAFATFNNLGGSCIGPVTTYEITVNPTLTSTSSVSNYNSYNISYFGGNDGFIDLTISGGSNNYTFSWSGPNGYTAITEDISNLIAGSYTVTINDGICGPRIISFNLIEPNELLAVNTIAALQNLLCFGESNGQLGVTITQESVPPYNFELFYNAVSIQNITNSTNLNPIFIGLSAGNYMVKITDANGVIKTLNSTLTEPSEIVVSVTSTPISCYAANDASINLTITGGVSPYAVNWSNLATGIFQNNLGPGTYNITITDALGCVKTIQRIIANLPVFDIQPVFNQITCYGAANGSINLGLIGGQAPIIVTWSDGSNAGLVRNNLTAGVYTATISDASTCSFTRTFTLIEPQPLLINGIVQNDLDCTTSNNGSVNLIVTGGTLPYTFNWSNGATTEDLLNVSNGNFSVVVTDARGCSITGQYTVFRPAPLITTLTQQKNVNCATGEIISSFEVLVNGGIPPYQIVWSTGTVSGTNNQFMSTTQDGLISVTATDSNGCSNTSSFLLDNPIIGDANFSLNSFSMNTFGEYSMGDPIQFTNLTIGDYIGISWNFGDGIFSTEENPIHTYLTEGEYEVTLLITYENGCTKEHKIVLNVTKGYKLIIPTGFTANDDVINDYFVPAYEGLSSLKMYIYDTWGNLIYYEEGDTIGGWDGKIKGNPAENGNYYYKLLASTFYKKNIEASGPFILLK
jgi:large repetitive protein